MKTSNKILLGTFLAALLILASVHIALFARYKKGQYTLITDDMWPTNFLTQSFQNVQYVSVSNLISVTVEPGDSTKLQYLKNNEDSSFRFLQKGDTLFLMGKPDQEHHRNWNPPLRVTLAGNNKLIANNSDLVFNGFKVPGSSSWNISLDKTELIFQTRESGERGYFDNATVNAANDSRLILRNANFKNLQLQLKNSSVDDADASVDSLFITTDSRSKIALKAENLLKAKTSSNE